MSEETRHIRQQVRDDVVAVVEPIYGAAAVFKSPRLALQTLPSAIVWIAVEPLEYVTKDEEDQAKNIIERRVTGQVIMLEAADVDALDQKARAVEIAIANLKHIKKPEGWEYALVGTTISVSDQESAREYIEAALEFRATCRTHEDKPS